MYLELRACKQHFCVENGAFKLPSKSSGIGSSNRKAVSVLRFPMQSMLCVTPIYVPSGWLGVAVMD